MAIDPNNPTASGMTLTFDDEFNSASISNDGAKNGTLWNDHIWFAEARPDLMNVSDGVLHMKTDPNANWAPHIQTTNGQGEGFAQKYGYFEASIDVSGDPGTWPSFWMLNNDRLSNGPGASGAM